MKTIEEISEEIISGLHKDEKKIIKCWNHLFPEEIIGLEIFSENKEKTAEVRDELLEIIREEIIIFENIEKIKSVYKFITEEDFPETIDENLSIEDWEEE